MESSVMADPSDFVIREKKLDYELPLKESGIGK